MVHWLHLCPLLCTTASACTHHSMPTATRTSALEGSTGLKELEMQPLLLMISKGWKNEPNTLAR